MPQYRSLLSRKTVHTSPACPNGSGKAFLGRDVLYVTAKQNRLMQEVSAAQSCADKVGTLGRVLQVCLSYTTKGWAMQWHQPHTLLLKPTVKVQVEQQPKVIIGGSHLYCQLAFSTVRSLQVLCHMHTVSHAYATETWQTSTLAKGRSKTRKKDEAEGE